MAEGLSDYLRAIGRVPMLSADEQIMLGTSVRRWLDDPEPTPAVIRRGRRAKERMVTANLRLVVSWAKRYQNKGVSFDDLVQDGNLGLIRAVEKYDPSTGYRFSTYATWWIRQGLSKAITDKSSTIRRAGSAQARRNKVNAVIAEYSREHGRPPSTAEIAAEMGVPEKLLVEMMSNLATAENLMSLDAQVNCSDSASTYGELIADEKSLEDPLDAMDREMAIEAMHDAVAALPRRHREVMEAQLCGRSMGSLAKESGISTATIRLRAEGAHRAIRLRLSGTPAPVKPAPSAYPHLCVKQLSEQLQELDLLAA